MKIGWAAWWNGVITVVVIILFTGLFRSAWLHNIGDIWMYGFLLFLGLLGWAGSFLEATDVK